MLLRCCLIQISIIILRNFLHLLYSCPCLDQDLFFLVPRFVSYICDLFFVFIFIFITINRIISWIPTSQQTQTSLRRLQDVSKRSRGLTIKQDVAKTSGKRRRIYDVLRMSDLHRLEDVQFTTFWRHLIYVVLKTSGLGRLIYDILKTSDLQHL